MATLFISLGKGAGLQPGDLAGMMYSEADLPRGAIGKIGLFQKHALVDIRAEHAQEVIDKCRNSTLRGKPFKIGLDRK
jgi:hypothetical protein